MPRRLNYSRGLLGGYELLSFFSFLNISGSQMNINPLPSSSADRRNISSLLNPSKDMDSTTSGPEASHAQLNSYPRQPHVILQDQQHSGLALLSHAGTTHHSHLFPPLPPSHPLHDILVQTTPDPSSFRLSRASWDGGDPPPEGFEQSGTKGNCMLGS